MRISDWSSDVCSSDLHAGASADQQPDHVASKRGDRSDQSSAQPYKPALFVSPTAQAVRPADATAFGRGAAHRLQRPEHRPGVPNDLRQDRKSGEQGKSVSVRADLGGRRKLKKKKKKV